jgi:hypothetical protein
MFVFCAYGWVHTVGVGGYMCLSQDSIQTSNLSSQTLNPQGFSQATQSLSLS